jgi:hypothetical protein
MPSNATLCFSFRKAQSRLRAGRRESALRSHAGGLAWHGVRISSGWET